MPTVETKKTRAERVCEKCRTLIPKGGEYRSWAHFRQKPHAHGARLHADQGRPHGVREAQP